MEAPPVDSLPVQFISEKDFTQLTQGVKNAPKLKIDMPKPLADKVDAPKPVDQLAPKVADKPEITTDTSSKSSPQPKPDTEARSEAGAKSRQAAKPPDYKPDQIADLLKKDAAKNPPKPDDKSAPQKPQTRPNSTPIRSRLARQARSAAPDGVERNDQQHGQSRRGAGAPTAQLSQSEIDALRARISSCWSPPPGVDANSKVYVVLRVLFKPDGTLAQEPVLVEATASALGPALAESAKRALLLCQPFTMLKPEHYDQWKDLELKFDPHELLGG